MALYAIEGGVGAGKTFMAVNSLLADYLRESRRPIYTNLPIDGDELEFFLCWLSKNPALRESYRERIHFLVVGTAEAFEEFWCETFWVDHQAAGSLIPRELWPLPGATIPEGFERVDKELTWPKDRSEVKAYEECGAVIKRRSLGMHDRIAEFWFFTQPNSVVFLDETADVFNALKTKDRPETLAAYIRMHRHYKDDLYFFMQDRDDVDVQIRRKILYVYHVENMKNHNMFRHWSVKGLRWPMQWFRVRVYLGRKVLGKGGDLERFEPLRSFSVWPSKRKYRNYRSFSAGVQLAGKRLPAEDDRSSDLDSPWERIRDFLTGAWAPLAVLVFLGVALVLGVKLVFKMGAADSDSVGKRMGWQAKGVAPAVVVHREVAAPPVVVLSNVVDVVKKKVDVYDSDEKIVFAGPSSVRTSVRTIRVGDDLGRWGVVRRILINGFEFADGRQYKFERVLFHRGEVRGP